MVGVVAAPGSVLLKVSSQSSRAGHLTIARVLVPDASWVVVTAPRTAQSPERVVGLVRVPAGDSRNVDVALGRGVALDQRLAVTLHVDRGVAGRFEFDRARFDTSPDKPYYVAGGDVTASIVKDTALVSLATAAGAKTSEEPSAAPGTAVLEVADRLTVINDLVVDRVVAPAPSWVAVYSVDGQGRPVELVGSARVGAGETLGVVVTIASDRALSDKVLVALQADLGLPGVFEFTPGTFSASPDKPWSVGGAEVSRAVILRGYGMSNDNMIDPGGAGM
jgi:hypothetical protein